MAREAFIERKFSSGSMAIINAANQIIRKYQAAGFTLTLRQLYYQFVSKDLLPNRQSEYKRLGSIINDARLAGLLDWAAIEDRTRNVKRQSAWAHPSEIMEAIAEQYAENPWLKQTYAPEIWIEKDALIGVIEPACKRWHVPFFACRGYSSQSEQYAAGKRFAEVNRERPGRIPIVFHLGDHDPSGIDMTRDNEDRLSMFARFGVEVKRLALNWDQIQQYSPPPNPAKETDSRAAGYMERFGDSSWELDALEPTVIDELIDDAVRELVDQDLWDEVEAQVTARRATLRKLADQWDSIADRLDGEGDDE